MVDAIIIGAGMSGLTAARTLVDAGKQVIVLEARERIGGRLYTRHRLADVPVELGGELIHGRNAATWELIKAHNLDTAELQVEDDPNKPSLRDTDLSALPEPNQDESLQDYAARTGLSGHKMPLELRYLDVDDEPLRRSSAGYVLRSYQQEIAEGELYGEHDFRIPGGYDQLLDILAKDIQIELGARVEEIDWSCKGEIMVSFWQEHAMHTLAAKEVVITLPIGILKHDDVQFIPRLPDEKQDAIQACSTVDVAKLIYVFKQKITPDQTHHFWAPNQNPPFWWKGTVGTNSNQDVLIGWAAGDNARKLLAMDYNAALKHGLKSLQKLLDRDDLRPATAIMHNWAGDPFTRGAYSYVPAGEAYDLHEVLAKPTENRLFWAGEATNSGNAATVHGAYESGLRAAREVLDA